MSSWERKYLDQQRKAIAATRKLWTNECKPERERMIVRAFLRCIGVTFASEEVRSPQEDPPDVVFRDAAFEVTEDLGGRKRGDEWREREERFAAAKSIEDVMEPYTPSQQITAGDSWQQAVDALGKKAIRYGISGCAHLDGLVYLTPGGAHMWPIEAISTSDLTEELVRQGWRSASLLLPPYGVVLSAGSDAPEFMKALQGRTLNEWPDQVGAGLFD